MRLANVMAKTVMCAAVFAVGCDSEWDGLEEDPRMAANEAEIDALDGSDEVLFNEDELSLMDLGPVAAGATVVGVETLTVTIPGSLHAQGLALPARLVRPKWSAPVGKRPAMLVLHGSGGLLKDPKSLADNPCSSQMESQFVTWADRLAKLGYTVLLPSSYSARGFCDKHTDAGRIPKTFDSKTEQILGRIYDTDAASRYLCARSEVNCDRMGLLGFSQGATMVMLALHWQMEHAISYFRKYKAKEVDFPVVDLKPGRPEFQMGVAYYPGCGFDGLVPLDTASGAPVEDKFTPTAPLTVLHGSKDDLVSLCSTSYGTGTRQLQAKQVASKLGVSNTYQVTVYANASHGFDSGSSIGADATARDAALKVTLSRLATQL